jgi:hypothetical protein
MKRLLAVPAASACLVLAGIAPALAAVAVPVAPVPGAISTQVFGVNDANAVAGSFVGDDGVEHAFFGPYSGGYTTFDAGAGGTQARGIDNSGWIAGHSNSQDGNTADQPIFERKPNGKVLIVTGRTGDVMGAANGINESQKMFAGTRWDNAEHAAFAFLGRRGKFRRDVKIPAVHQASRGLGINDTDVVVGSYFGPPDHGFILSGKVLATLDYPSDTAVATEADAINNGGQVAGQWTDDGGNIHSFLYDLVDGTFTDIAIKGAKQVQAWGINNAGAVAVSTDIGPYLWCASKAACPAGGTTVAAPVHRAATRQGAVESSFIRR